jgi:hypothetical protein
MIGRASVTSDANGAFSFANVTPPYDVYTVATSPLSGPLVIFYDDLTRSDPTIEAGSSGFIVLPLASTADVSGTISGGASFDASHKGVTIWSTGGKDDTISPAGAYAFTSSWPQAPTRTGNMCALQWSLKPSGAPDTFTGYGQTAKTLTASMAATVNVTLGGVSTATVTGMITAPAGFPTPTLTLTTQLSSVAYVLWTATANAIDAGIPIHAGDDSTVYAITTAANGSQIEYVLPELVSDTDASFQLPAPPALMAPSDAATGVGATTTFSIGTVPSSVSAFTFASTSSTKQNFRIVTSASQIKLPVIPELPTLANNPYTWRALAFGPYSSVNDAATPAGLGFISSSTMTGTVHFEATSATRSFTTAP